MSASNRVITQTGSRVQELFLAAIAARQGHLHRDFQADISGGELALLRTIASVFDPLQRKLASGSRLI